MSLYPNLPALRIPWDRNGSVLFATDGTSVEQAGLAQMQAVNDESDSTGWTPTLDLTGGAVHFVGVLFPGNGTMAVTLPSICRIVAAGLNADHVWYSSDSTDGANGTWGDGGGWSVAESSADAWRSGVGATTGAAARAVRFRFNGATTQPVVKMLHLYGTGHNFETNYDGSYQDRVKLYPSSSNSPYEGDPFAVDWGDTPRTTSNVKLFHLMNLSNTHTVNNTVISLEALTDSSPSMVGQYSFSRSSSTGPFTSTVTFPAIAPNAYDNFWVRRTTASNMPLGPWACRIVATPGSFT